MKTKKIKIYGNGGSKLAGDLYLPKSSKKKYPTILLCQGLSGVKDKVLPIVAKSFANEGYVALAFDYRGSGESENARKRPYINPTERIEDAKSALYYLAGEKCVDSKRIGLYSISYGGPVAICLAASEKIIRCLSIVSSPVDGDVFMESLRTKSELKDFYKCLLNDRIKRSHFRKSKMVSIEYVVPFSKSFWEKYKTLSNTNESESIPEAHGKSKKPMLSLESADAMLDLFPSRVINKISSPLIFIHGEKDDVAYLSLVKKMYKKANQPKKIIVYKNMDHIDLDRGEGLKKQVNHSINWFKKYL